MSITNYQEALHELLSFDIGRTAYFDVTITSPIINNTDKRLSYLCHSAELPGESIATVTQKIYGVVEKFPIMSAYNDINLSFYTKGTSYDVIRGSFLDWITTATGRKGLIGSTEDVTYNVQYKRDICGTIIITQYDSMGNAITKCKLIDAFPLSINQTPLSWSAANQAISLNVTFAYTEYEYILNGKEKDIQIPNAFSTETNKPKKTWTYNPYSTGSQFNYMSNFNVNSTQV